jgi:hypothetical protein
MAMAYPASVGNKLGRAGSVFGVSVIQISKSPPAPKVYQPQKFNVKPT